MRGANWRSQDSRPLAERASTHVRIAVRWGMGPAPAGATPRPLMTKEKAKATKGRRPELHKSDGHWTVLWRSVGIPILPQVSTLRLKKRWVKPVTSNHFSFVLSLSASSLPIARELSNYQPNCWPRVGA